MKNFDIDIASITGSPNPDNSGITIRLIPGESYGTFTGSYKILRGRYGYKTSLSEASTHTLLESSDPIIETTILDDSVEPGVLYYYSIIFEISSDGSNTWQYNPNKHLITSFGNKYMTYRDSIFDLLPANIKERDENGYLRNLIAVYSYPIEIARTEVDIRLLNNDPFYVPEENLPALASLIGWRVNRELDVETQRFEILKSTETYQSKGRHYAITNLIEFITGWKVTVEEGHYRVFELGDSLVDQDDTYQITHVNLPWLLHEEEFIADGSPSQEYTLTYNTADRIVVTIDDEDWWEVEDLLDYGDEQVFKVGDSGTDRILYFGDGTNGAMPDGIVSVRYVYGGDTLTYTPDPFRDWKHDTGFRLLLEQQEGSVPFNDIFINKVARIVDLFKASYASYVIYILGSFSDVSSEETPVPIDESTITTTEYGWFILDESLLDDETQWMV